MSKEAASATAEVLRPFAERREAPVSDAVSQFEVNADGPGVLSLARQPEAQRSPAC